MLLITYCLPSPKPCLKEHWWLTEAELCNLGKGSKFTSAGLKMTPQAVALQQPEKAFLQAEMHLCFPVYKSRKKQELETEGVCSSFH